jgi:hypothetical protein
MPPRNCRGTRLEYYIEIVIITYLLNVTKELHIPRARLPFPHLLETHRHSPQLELAPMKFAPLLYGQLGSQFLQTGL